MTSRKILFSGIQPTGEVHIGNYIGAIKNWVDLIPEYDCIYSIVDYHAITTPFDPSVMNSRIIDTAISCIACGLDPDRCIFFVQSMVPEHIELAWILSTVTRLGVLSRMTQFKEKAKEHKKDVNLGLYSYPVLQTADILLYKAEVVPVGEDQVQHLELAREIASKFNKRFGWIFPEPYPYLSPVKRVLGLDGKSKMSKSLGNHISLTENDEDIRNKLAKAVTDEDRKRRTDPGNPEKCNIWTLHRFFSKEEERSWVWKGCTTAGIGCLECKELLSDNMINHLSPIRENIFQMREKKREIVDILRDGGEKAKGIARQTISVVRETIGVGI